MKCLVYTVSTIIFITYVSVMYVVVYPNYEYHFHTLLGNIDFVFKNFLLFMVIFSYRNIVTTGPGRIPPGWAPKGFNDEELEEARQVNEKRRKFYEPHIIRYCKKCQAFKPPRSHHCRECNL